jgi:cytochrome b561
MLKNTENSYGSITKIFHWIIGFSIIGLIAVGFTMSSMDPSPEKFELYGMHKAFGVTVLLLVTLRILWRFVNVTVHSAKGVPTILQLAAKAGHLFLYIFMLMMPISGVLMSRFGGYPVSVFNLFTIPAAPEKNAKLAGLFHSIHEIAALGFAILILVHILAALYHHYIRKDTTLTRMMK